MKSHRLSFHVIAGAALAVGFLMGWTQRALSGGVDAWAFEQCESVVTSMQRMRAVEQEEMEREMGVVRSSIAESMRLCKQLTDEALTASKARPCQ